MSAAEPSTTSPNPADIRLLIVDNDAAHARTVAESLNEWAIKPRSPSAVKMVSD